MIYTSYFAMIKKFPANFYSVSIARYTPKGIDIPKILQIAPTGDILSEYKKTQNKENYIKRYIEEVLKKYSAAMFVSMIQEFTNIPDVAENPNEHVVLCCYEKSEDFCHRHLFADFLSKENIPVKELSLKELEKDKNTVKTLTFTGRRPKYLFGYEDKQSYLILCKYLYTKVERLFKEGFTRFISGGAQGFDQCAFRVVNALEKHYPDAGIKNILYLPCKNQAGKWGDTGLFGKSEYEKMLKAADEIRYISDEYTNRCLIKRNHAMVDDSDAVIGLFSDETYEKLYSSGTAECLNYAKDKGIDIYQITYSEDDILNTLGFKQITDIFDSNKKVTYKTKQADTMLKNNDIGKYIKAKQADLAAQYKYKPLPPLISKMQRQEYEDNLPEYWKNYKEGNIYTLDGVLIATGLTDRKYVCGDYGIFLEINNQSIVKQNIVVKKGQEYRINDPKYSEHVKYQWFSPKNGADVKLYFQQKGVAYADYKPGKWYVSPYEVIEDTELAKLDKDNIQAENNCIYDYD